MGCMMASVTQLMLYIQGHGIAFPYRLAATGWHWWEALDTVKLPPNQLKYTETFYCTNHRCQTQTPQTYLKASMQVWCKCITDTLWVRRKGCELRLWAFTWRGPKCYRSTTAAIFILLFLPHSRSSDHAFIIKTDSKSNLSVLNVTLTPLLEMSHFNK